MTAEEAAILQEVRKYLESYPVPQILSFLKSGEELYRMTAMNVLQERGLIVPSDLSQLSRP